MTNLNNFYIIVLDDPNDRLELQFLPEEVSVSSTASIEAAATPARNNSRFFYYGGDDAINFSLSFFAENNSEAELREVKRRVDWLHSLRYEGKDVLCIFGDLFPTTPLIVDSVSIKKSLIDEQGLYKSAEVSLSFKVNPSENLTGQDIRNQ